MSRESFSLVGAWMIDGVEASLEKFTFNKAVYVCISQTCSERQNLSSKAFSEIVQLTF